MEKVVIVTRQMVMGGIEKALISMLEAMDQNKYDVTVLVMAKEGELFKDIPNWVKVRCLYGNEKTTIEKIIKYIKLKDIKRVIKIIYYTVLSKTSNSVFKKSIYDSKMLPIEDEEYDIAISYHVPASFPVIYVSNNIKANNKIAWIHSDVSQYEDYMKLYSKYYDNFNKIMCVSKDALEKFIEMFPKLEHNTKVCYNLIPRSRINYMSNKEKGFQDDFNGIRILTVGRLTEQKGQDLIPEILEGLKTDNYDIRWYCIGDGDKREGLEESIKEKKLENDLILLGTKLNPYPFIKECDIYVQPSRHEGYCITLAEARVLNKPIVTTDFIGARDQIVNNKTGIIVRFDKNEISNAIIKLIENKGTRNKLVENLRKENKDRIKVHNIELSN